MKYKKNFKNKANGLDVISSLKRESVKVVFFDPQYRGVLDKLKYGNEGKQRGKQRTSLTQMSEDTIKEFLIGIERILKPDGYLFLWVDKFHLVEGIKPWLKNLNTLECVDMITWNKLKIGMGYRTRRKSEYLVVIQKEPRHAKTTWKIHNIPDVWEEKISIRNHTHAKPVELQKQLILSTTEKGDLIGDFCAGGYSVLTACKLADRDFIGCDIEFGE